MKIIDADYARLIGPDAGDVVIRGDSKEHALVGGVFEGVDRFNRDLALWHPAIQSPDSEILPNKGLADARSRDISRNDAYVQSGLRIRQDSIVGEFYFLNAKPNLNVLDLDETWASEFQEEVENKFTLWAESDKHWVDASRINTLTSMVRMAVGIQGMSGEFLATAEWLRDMPRPFNTAVQMIDVDRLSTPWGQMDGPLLRGGIERNRFGAPQAYHIRLAHPNDYFNSAAYEWKRVPARKPWGREQVLHIYDQSRPDQTRGISDMVAALKAMKITAKFRDITLQNAVVNATYAASIESEMPAETVYAAMGAGNMNPDNNAIVAYAKAFLEAIGQYAGTSKNMHIDGVKIPHLFPGTKLQLRPAGTPGGVGESFEASLLRYIAANLGVSYEELSRDFSKSNYASFRGASGMTHKFMRAQKKSTADRTANFVYLLWLEEALNKNMIDSMPSKATGWWYEPMMLEALGACTWIGTGRGQIDELKETQAAVLRLKNNLTTHEEEIARLGGDYRKVFAQKQREKEDMEERDIMPVEDAAMMNAATGEPGSTGDEPDGEGDGSGGDKKRAETALENLMESVLDQSERVTEALVAASTRTPAAPQVVTPEPPIVNFSPRIVTPKISVNVKSLRNGKTQTRVLQHDEKGRIIRTETVPMDGDDE